MADLLENIICFPTILYHVEKPEFLAAVRKVSSDHLSCSGALHDLYPVRKTGSLHDDPSLRDFSLYIAVTAGNILGEQCYAMQGLATYFTQMFVQEHHKHSGMDQHVHPGDKIVGFYFIDVPDGSSVATFHDPRAGKVMAGLPEREPTEITYASDAFHFAPKPGLLLFTNAWLAHSFTRHGSNKPLRFIHFNVAVTAADAPPPAEVI